MKKFLTPLIASALSLAAISASHAVTIYNANVTAILGAGNPDGGWVADNNNGFQSAVRFKNTTDGSTNNNGAGTYILPFVGPLGTVNFEFSATTPSALSNYSYLLRVDTDSSEAGVNYSPFSFDPSLAFSDNSFGTAATPNGGGVEGSFLLYGTTNNIFQNSQKLSTFGDFTPGVYDVRFDIVSKDLVPATLATSTARVALGVTPTQSTNIPDTGNTLGMLLTGVLAMGVITAKKKYGELAHAN